MVNARPCPSPGFPKSLLNRYPCSQAPPVPQPGRRPLLTNRVIRPETPFNQLREGYPGQARSVGSPRRHGAYAEREYALQCRGAHPQPDMSDFFGPLSGPVDHGEAPGLLPVPLSPPSDRAPRGGRTHPSLYQRTVTGVRTRRDPQCGHGRLARARRFRCHARREHTSSGSEPNV